RGKATGGEGKEASGGWTGLMRVAGGGERQPRGKERKLLVVWRGGREDWEKGKGNQMIRKT
ncbi:MAG: hypothetical protein J6T47_02495, partial [Lachnospiraceae bacterium]|nr:hypothetical protein [Lachnospiraceae bacterium]